MQCCVLRAHSCPCPAASPQAAEERALAGKCGNPLCTHPPAASSSSPHRGRYHISTREQAVYEVAGEERPIYCSPDCQVAVKHFAARLGSGALALDRFTAAYDELKRREAEVNAAAKQAQQAEQPQQPQQPPVQQGTSAQPPVQQGAAAASASAASAGGSSSACAGGADTVPGGICSGTPLVPRLAVEQVEVKHIHSSAGQFGDFSRKPKQRPAEAADGAPRPKGVLKKQSQFAAGTSKVPIMLAEVKVRPGVLQQRGRQQQLAGSAVRQLHAAADSVMPMLGAGWGRTVHARGAWSVAGGRLVAHSACTRRLIYAPNRPTHANLAHLPYHAGA